MNSINVVWNEFQIFKNKFWGITISSMISPILYMIAFGWGVGSNIGTDPTEYINFIVSGIIAMTTMNVSYSSVATSLNISRTYDKTFEQFMMSPIKPWEYTIGRIAAGALRGMYSGVIITTFGLLFSNLKINGIFIVFLILNCIVFSSLGFIIGMIINSHADMSKFNSFIITPMSFLCGTFFPIGKMPLAIRTVVGILPLSQTNFGLRYASAYGEGNYISIIILLGYLFVFLALGIFLCGKAE